MKNMTTKSITTVIYLLSASSASFANSDQCQDPTIVPLERFASWLTTDSVKLEQEVRCEQEALVRNKALSLDKQYALESLRDDVFREGKTYAETGSLNAYRTDGASKFQQVQTNERDKPVIDTVRSHTTVSGTK